MTDSELNELFEQYSSNIKLNDEEHQIFNNLKTHYDLSNKFINNLESFKSVGIINFISDSLSSNYELILNT